MTKAGFGRRSWTKLRPKWGSDTDNWFDQGAFARGWMNGQCIQAWFFDDSEKCEYYTGGSKDDSRWDDGKYFSRHRDNEDEFTVYKDDERQ